jgi:hypothetical protein
MTLALHIMSTLDNATIFLFAVVLPKSKPMQVSLSRAMLSTKICLFKKSPTQGISYAPKNFYMSKQANSSTKYNSIWAKLYLALTSSISINCSTHEQM